MANKEPGFAGKWNSSQFGASELVAMGKKSIEECATVQTELLDQLREANRQWLDRMQSEASLTAELALKLTTARSIPDAMNACQQWTTQHFEALAEDSKHFLTGAQRFMGTSTKFFSNGRLTDHTG